MGTLYVTETGVQVHKEGQRLLLKKGTEVLQDIPLIKVDRVVLMGKGASVTTPALYALAQRKVGVYFLNSIGRFMLRMEGDEHNHSRLRMAQARAADHQNLPLTIAKAIVIGKVTNQRVLVQRHSERAPWSRDALAQMDAMRRQVDSARTLDELRGYEGLAARDYFHLMRQILRPPVDGSTWGFNRRVYYPSTDPINALLSFGYTLLLNELIAACQISGLDPDIGFFHTVDYNKPSMALDLEEEFRPVIVDSIVLAAVNRPVFGLRDFQAGKPAKSEEEDEETGEKPRSIYLTEPARRRFIQMYEARVNEQIYYPLTGEQTTYRRIFEYQAYQMARVILGEAQQYVPFTVR